MDQAGTSKTCPEQFTKQINSEKATAPEDMHPIPDPVASTESEVSNRIQADPIMSDQAMAGGTRTPTKNHFQVLENEAGEQQVTCREVMLLEDQVDGYGSDGTDTKEVTLIGVPFLSPQIIQMMTAKRKARLNGNIKKLKAPWVSAELHDP